MAGENKNMTHWVLGGLLLVVFVLIVALVFVYSKAGDTTVGTTPATSASINNTAPTTDTVTVAYTNNGASIPQASGIDLAIGTTKEVHIYGTVSDANGADDIANTALVFYRAGVTGGAGCTASNNSCYKVASCTMASSTPSTAMTYDCRIDVTYYTDSTDVGGEFPTDKWTAQVTATDKAMTTGVLTADTGVNTLLALNIPVTIAYGTFGVGESTTAANDQTMTIGQRGNAVADVEVSGTPMTCDAIGAIPTGNQKWALTNIDYGDAAAHALTGSPVNTILNVGYRHSDTTEVTKNLYWNIKIPDTGVKGACSGTDTVTVRAH